MHGGLLLGVLELCSISELCFGHDQPVVVLVTIQVGGTGLAVMSRYRIGKVYIQG